MKDRIKQIMESKHMTQTVFAQFLDMSPASLSSIFNDRTKPTLNFVEAIKKKIPNISTDWLMFGIGDMYTSTPSAADAANEEKKSVPGSLFDEFSDTVQHPSPVLDFNDGRNQPRNSAQDRNNFNSVNNTHPNLAPENAKIIDKPQRKVVEIRVFYDDQTWESFSASKK